MSRSYKDLTNPSTLKTETFQYDGLDRLRYAQVTGLQLQEVNYNPSGNIISKSGLGNYTYDQSKTNSLLNVGNNEQLISSNSQNIQYNYQNKPDLITEGVLEFSLIYGADNQRIKSILKNNGTEIRTMFYGPGYEKVVTPDSTWESCFISSPYGAEAVIVKKGTIERLYYIEKDHLGSIVGLISSTGSYVERHSYDPWGRRRNPTNWSFDNVPESKLTSWGYTGQEHLDMFGLINMNGRMYDPVIGRFLNLDPIIQNPFSSQDYNNYSYCINNPLRYIDPSGYTRSAVYASTITDPDDITAFLNAYFSQGGNLPYAESQVSGWSPTTIWYDDQTGMVDFWITVPGSNSNVNIGEYPSGIPIKAVAVKGIKVSVYLSILRNFAELDSKWSENGIDGKKSDGFPRLWDFEYRDYEVLTALSLSGALVTAAAVTTDPALSVPIIVVTTKVNQAVTIFLAADAYWDFREIESPQPSDVARYTLNMTNALVAFTFGWRVGIFTSVFGILDQVGTFNSFYERFNK
jgi:RHS repeat-associated protein